MNLLSSAKKIYLVLTLFVVIGGCFRIINLSTIPGGFHEDEAHIGYNAYSLLETLRDKNNVFLPLAIDQFGDFRPSGLHFLTVPTVALFGLTEFATRFPVAIFGTASIFLFYFLAQEIFRKRSIALIASGMIALNPWHIIASRSTSESIVALFFVIFGVYLLLRSLRIAQEGKKVQEVVISVVAAVISLLISFQFYHAARYFVPFIAVYIGLWVFLDQKIQVKLKGVISGAIIVLFAGLLFLFSVGNGSGRVSEISIFQHPATKIMLWEQMSEDKGYPRLAVQVFHNKLTAYAYTTFVNYGTHFTPDFLFFKGGLPPRYQVPWSGNFYTIDALFLIIGVSMLFATIFNAKKFPWLFSIPFVWLLTGPLPAAFTFEDMPHFQRSIMMLPAVLLFAAYGVDLLITRFSSRKMKMILVGLLGIIFAYQLLIFSHDYFQHTLTHQSKYRNEGEKGLLNAVSLYKNQGRKVIMTSEGANLIIFYLFFNKSDPAKFQALGSPRDKDGLEFDGVEYRKVDCPTYTANKDANTIYVDRGECLVSTDFRILKDIYRPDGTVVFRILEVATKVENHNK